MEIRNLYFSDVSSVEFEARKWNWNLNWYPWMVLLIDAWAYPLDSLLYNPWMVMLIDGTSYTFKLL